MKRTGCIAALSALFFLHTYSSVSAQAFQYGEELDLRDRGLRIDNLIGIYTSKAGYESIRRTSGGKVNIRATAVIINKDTLTPGKINTRGQTTLFYRRKNFSISIDPPAVFKSPAGEASFKKFYAQSLTMDRNYVNNRIAFRMMQETGIFGLWHTFSKLSVNDRCEGLYLVLERPEDFALKKMNSPMAIRRGFENRIQKTMPGDNVPDDTIKKYTGYFRQIYSSIGKYKGEALYRTISQWIDLETYMKWLAFNSFVRNKDYTDEIYLYVDPLSRKFSIIPWDYDDLFSTEPHEGTAASRSILGDKLLFSAEDRLDQKIAGDPFLYNIFLEQYHWILTRLTPEKIREILEGTFAELYPYYSDNEILEAAKYDLWPEKDIPKLKEDMITLYIQLMVSRNLYLKRIEELLEAR
ncbi:MAG: CotH kinase family protein [Bacteroidales bacterium]|nr:CotH kinase family protein [Bacteroidales bacterium]